MPSSKLLLAAEVLASVPLVQASHASVYSVGIFSDAACTMSTAEAKEAHEYELHQVNNDKHCYAHKGYSVKLLCDHDDTVKVAHWFDVNGKSGPCTGEALGQPLLEDVPWELAEGFLKGECMWNSKDGTYGKLSAALPLDGYPRCDFTGASIRRLTSNSSNSSNATAATEPASTTVNVTATTTANATANNTTIGENATTGENATAATTTVAVSADGVASGSASLCVASAVAAAAAVAVFTNIVV